jgi:superfamily II DNA/RNA helicase
LALIKEGTLKVDKLKRFIMDECDSLLQSLGMIFDTSFFI